METITAASPARIEVTYWRDTTRLTATATTYRGAMRIASRNRNAYPPTFRNADTGETLIDFGDCFVTSAERDEIMDRDRVDCRN